MSSDPEFLGTIENLDHSATPIVIGDYRLMHGWPGDMDGGNEGPSILGDPGPEALIYQPYLECTNPQAPSVYRVGDELYVLADTGPGTDNEPTPWVEQPFAPRATPRGVIPVRSGGLVLTLAYDCTPPAGTDTSDWEEEENFVEDRTPHLPAELPAEPTLLNGQLLVVPLEPGVYEVTRDYVEPVIRCRIARVPDASLTAYAEGLDMEELFAYEAR